MNTIAATVIVFAAFVTGPATASTLLTLAKFDAARGQHAENVAVAPNGTVYVSLLDSGAIYRLKPGAPATTFSLGAGEGARVTGLAIDRRGRVLVGVDRERGGQKGVWRLDPASGAARLVVTLPASVMVNGVALDARDRIYVADSHGGVIWRAPASGGSATAWLTSPSIAPKSRIAIINGKPGPTLAIGPNGVRFHNGALYISVSGQATLVRVPLDRDGRAGRAQIVIRGLFIDDFGFDRDGRIVVASDDRQLLATQVVRFERDGRRTILASDLQQPSAVAADPRSGRLYVSVLGLFGTVPRPRLIQITAP